ncbi:MAG: universal stress protein [Mycobacteriaceae bacterium]
MNNSARIVVGVDGSPSSHEAVRWAAAGAALRHAPLVLVSTYLMPLDIAYATVPLSYFAEQDGAAKRLLDEAAEMATTAAQGFGTVEISTELLTGRPIPHLLEQSKSAKMMVLGSRGLGEFAGGVRGSVSAALASHAHCPVAVIHGLPGPDLPALEGPVVVGMDGTKNSEPALAAAFEEADLRAAELVAVHTWTDVNLTSALKAYVSDMHYDWPSIQTKEEAVLSESMAGWQERYPGVKVRTVVARDRPVHNLLHQAENAQLVVVGSHGRGGFTGMLLGSTTRALLRTIDRPLMIVRAQG